MEGKLIKFKKEKKRGNSRCLTSGKEIVNEKSIKPLVGIEI